ncbi:hypothetical protein ACJMK2_029620 [Sinanodonta woodiana]|uniref:Uncharacterized protein n=1 Tax=Sinanodonta woodiana TaxID=1069815 RepID=A0ABD3XCR0_SINWO
MESNARSHNALVVHHILQVAGPAAIIIIGAVEPIRFKWLLISLITAIVPTTLFVILWIASKCNFKDLNAILRHFNPLLSALWFFVYFPICIRCSRFVDEALLTIAAILTGFLSLTSAMSAIYGIWKSARHVVLRTKEA